MKISSKKLLFLLYTADSDQVMYLPVSELSLLLNDITADGQRSLVYLLKKQQLLGQLGQGSQAVLYITDLGRRAIEQELAVFKLDSTWRGQWEIIVFRQGPRHDKNFHYLRTEMLKNGALPLSRGVYAFPARTPAIIRLKCATEYGAHLSLFTTNEWEIGAPRDIAITTFSLNDLSESYSGISRELDELLISNYPNKGLNYQYKYQIHSLYGRFFANVCEDTGLVGFYFQNTPHFLSLLKRFQQTLSISQP